MLSNFRTTGLSFLTAYRLHETGSFDLRVVFFNPRLEVKTMAENQRTEEELPIQSNNDEAPAQVEDIAILEEAVATAVGTFGTPK